MPKFDKFANSPRSYKNGTGEQDPQTPGTDVDIESIGDDDAVSVAGTQHSYNYNVTTGMMEQETLENIPNYKRETLEAVIQESSKQASGRDVINQLKDFGITVYLTEQNSVNIDVIANVVDHVSSIFKDKSRADYDYQRCLLYRDEAGRLYNLTMGDHSVAGLANTWKSLLVSFSGLEAMFAITILARVFACAGSDAGVRPGYLSLILGLVLFEEMSHVWVNCAMFVRGTPSISAYTLISNFDSDWPRKFAIFVLALAAAQGDIVGDNDNDNGNKNNGGQILTLVGVASSVLILTANLGARAWYFMKWRPIGQGGVFAPIASFLLAVAMGLVFPFMGFRSVQAGGVRAMQDIILNSFLVGIVFLVSDLDVVQQFLIVGSESCNQDYVNIAVGIWLPLTTIVCLFAAQNIAPREPHPVDDDPILVEDQSSPVGYKVPNFPDYPIDPVLIGGKGLPGCTMGMEKIVGVILSIAVGALIVCSGFYNFMDTANDMISTTQSSAVEPSYYESVSQEPL